MGSATFILMVITILSKISGLLREQFTAVYLGTGSLADIYSTATNIPYTIFGFVVAGVGTSFIPIYNKIRKEKGEKEADQYTANLANILVVVAFIIVAIIVVFAPIIVKLFAAGYSDEKARLTIHFTRIISLSTLIALSASVYIAYLNLKGSFTVPALTGVIMNILHIITFVIAFKLNNFFIIAVGYVLSDFIKYIMFPKTLRKVGYRHNFKLNFNDPNIKLMIAMSVPIILSIAAVDISTIVDQSLASLLNKGAHGAVSALRYAILILQLISGVIVVSIATALYPRLSSYAVEKKRPLLKKTMMEAIVYAQLLVVPSMIGAMVLAEPLVTIIFKRGNFNATSTLLTSTAMFYYLPSLFGLTIRDLVVRGFYAQRDIKTPVKITVIQEVLHVIFSIAFSSFMGVAGLALATSVSSIIGGVLITNMFRKKYGKLNIKNFSIKMVKIIIASLIMGLFTHLIYKALLPKSMIIAFIVSVLASLLIYAILIILLKIPEVKKGLLMIIKRFSKKK